MTDKYKIDEFIDSHKNEMITFLEDLVRIPSIRGEQKPGMPYGAEIDRALRFAGDTAEKKGFKTENFDNRVKLIKLGAGERKLGILCHLDVVEVNAEKWDTPPFEPVIKDGMIYGRGVLDNKGPSAAALYALYAVKQLNTPLKKEVCLYMGADEEKGFSDFKEYLKSNSFPEFVFVPDACFPVGVAERGLVRLSFTGGYASDKIICAHSGEVINVIPDTATAKFRNVSASEVDAELSEIGNIKYETVTDGKVTTVTIYGKSAHAAGPWNGANAATALLKLLAAFDEKDGIFSRLTKLLGHNLLCGEGFGIAPEKTTLSLTVFDYSNEILNLKTDSRVAVTESSKEILEKITSQMPLDAEILCADEPHNVPKDFELVRILQKIYTEQTGRNEDGYSTDGITYAHLKSDAVIFGGVMYDDGSCNAHGENECYNLETLVTAAKMFAKAIVEICG